MKRSSTLLAAILAAACASSGPAPSPAAAAGPGPAPSGAPAAQSGPAGRNPAQVIAFLDASGDGKVDKAEYVAFQLGRFGQFDVDKSGGLSLEEFRDAQPGEQGKTNAPRTYRMFTPGTAAMSAQQWGGFHSFVFTNFVDGDRDGFMSGEEWVAIMNR
jgi:hypothetical protein